MRRLQLAPLPPRGLLDRDCLACDVEERHRTEQT